jgi:hypothetical protein
MWCFLSQREGDVKINALTDRYIRLDESTRTEPQESNAANYADIYQNYLKLNEVMKPMY